MQVLTFLRRDREVAEKCASEVKDILNPESNIFDTFILKILISNQGVVTNFFKDEMFEAYLKSISDFVYYCTRICSISR